MQAFRTSVQRKYFIDKKIRDNTYPSTVSLANDYEKEYGKKLDPRTMATDISELRQIYKAPIKFDSKKRGYIYTDNTFQLNVLDGETSGIPLDVITKTSAEESKNPAWQKELLASFMKEVLPTTKDNSLNTLVTILPSEEDEANTHIEKFLLKSLRNAVLLTLEISIDNTSCETIDFLPLHLVCKGSDRLYFGKVFCGTIGKFEFRLIDIAIIKNVAVSYLAAKKSENSKALADSHSLDADYPLYVIDEDYSQETFYYAQTTGNDDVEIIMQKNGKRHILVFSCYPSMQSDNNAINYTLAGEFILNSIE